VTKCKELLDSSAVRILLLCALYSIVLIGSRWLAYGLRFDFAIPPEYKEALWGDAPWVIGVKVAVLYLFGQFSGLLSYFSVPDLKRIFSASVFSTIVLFAVRSNSTDFYVDPRGMILLDFLFSFAGLAGVRLGFRVLRERGISEPGSPRRCRRVGIIGAGDAGAKLARELLLKRSLGLQPVVFFDDDSGKWHSRVHDIPIAGAPEELLKQPLPFEIDEVIIAMPSAPARRMREVVKVIQQANLKFETVPSLDQLATGQIKVSQLRSVEIQDLLGRDAVKLETDNIREILRGRIVMVTGAGGSIGSELCRQIAFFGPRKLLLVEQSVQQLLPIEQELRASGYQDIVVPLVADILDRPRMEALFATHQPQTLFHAAAHKHVPLMESQPSEAIKNNSFGTARLAELALQHRVERFVLISSDKAINPTNVMGATKRLAEIFIQSMHASCPDQTKFMAVRFGNVLGSSGSVIPTFKKQIAAGGPVTVTHPEMTRYFMTIPEAVGLVLQSAAQGQGGEIFVLDMGKPVKIVDLARQLIDLSGFKPGEDIDIVFSGLRPGEKLFEELSHHGENISPTHHPKIMRFVSQPLPLKQVREFYDELTTQLDEAEPNQLKLLLQQVVPEYKPWLGQAHVA
jgi:FlaA1/EpsC-like NDP-sugar epimerase